jgi:multidrug efflux pump subunit AcrB
VAVVAGLSAALVFTLIVFPAMYILLAPKKLSSQDG